MLAGYGLRGHAGLRWAANEGALPGSKILHFFAEVQQVEGRLALAQIKLNP